MSDEKIPSRKGKVSTTEEIRRMRNKHIVPDMQAMKRSRNSDGKLYLNADHPSVTKNEVKRFNKIFSQGTGAGSAPHTLSERQVHNAYSMMKKKFVNPKDGSPDNLTNKEIKDLIYRKGQTDVRVNPVPKKIKQSKKDNNVTLKKPINKKTVASKKPTGKKITPAQQKVINQAAPVIEKIKKGYKKGSPVKFAPKPEKPIIPKRGGGMTRQGLYPAEESRSGTMSEDERKRYMTMGKKGGGIVYRNMGRAIGGDMGGVSTVSYFYDD